MKYYCVIHWYGPHDAFQVYGPWSSYAEALAFNDQLLRANPDTRTQLMRMSLPR